MPRHPAGFAAALGLILSAASSVAAPPQINAITPFGVQRGTAADLTVTGANMGGNPRLIAPFGFVLATPAPAGSDAANMKLKLTVDPGVAVGVYPVRVQTDDGISNPFLFAVGQLPQVTEKEDNSTFETAQQVAVPAVIEGQAAGNDVDYYKFTGKKGQRIVVDAQCARIGSGVDPSIRLTTAARGFVASADDSPGLLTDARLFALLPEDTDYIIELSDTRYQGGGRPVYRLLVGDVPVAEELYPIGGRTGETLGLELRGGSLDEMKIAATRVLPTQSFGLSHVRATGSSLGLAGPSAGLDVESLPALIAGDVPEIREPADPAAPPLKAAVPVVLNGRIDPPGDEDRFALAVTPGQKLRIEVEAAESGSALDGVLQVIGTTGTVLATADDTTVPANQVGGKKAAGSVSPDPSLEYTVLPGQTEVHLALRDLESRGGVGFPYRISVHPIKAAFDVNLTDAQVSVPKGGTAAVHVSVVRKGYNGPITLKVADPPAGLTFRPGTIPDGQLFGVLTVTAAADAPFGPSNLTVTGEGQGAEGPLLVKADKILVFAQQATLPTNTLTQAGLVVAPALALPLSLDAPVAPIEVVHGYGSPVPVKVTRGPSADGALSVSVPPQTPPQLPPGLAVPAAPIADKAAEGPVTVNTTTDTPLGLTTVAFVAQGKIAGVDRSFTVPAVTVNVIRPAVVEVATAAVEVKPEATVEIKGKITRKGPFKEPVTVKLNGLPAGTKADPVTLAPDASEFTFKLTADAKAAPATAAATVALAFQVNKKDYPPQTAPVSVKIVPAK